MLWNLLAEGENGNLAVVFGVIIILAVPFMLWNRYSQKKREKEINDTLDAIQPGNKVKTIGGICGVVAEVCPEDNTFILETGSETTGKSYIKFDKKAVYQTDAKKEEAPVEEAPVEETLFDGEPVQEEVVEAPVEEAPTEEVATEEVAVEAVEEAPAETTEE